ncbi:MAG: PRC-barrel domain-containing protein [Methanobrevibacter sp.]|jgi:sporulation protein YlmC with PRC-barrel domain|nr:PRC-barrel domain-containing protein [Candidatus Methanovirga meridionalis]
MKKNGVNEIMVEVSNLYNLDIYTIEGLFVGKVVDVVLNIKLGIISKLKVKTFDLGEKKDVGIMDMIKTNFQLVADENHINKTYSNELFDIEYDKVRAIGDIMLIDPKNLTSTSQESNPQINKTLSDEL